MSYRIDNNDTVTQYLNGIGDKTVFVGRLKQKNGSSATKSFKKKKKKVIFLPLNY